MKKKLLLFVFALILTKKYIPSSDWIMNQMYMLFCRTLMQNEEHFLKDEFLNQAYKGNDNVST